MPLRECLNFREFLNGNLAAVFADGVQKGVSGPAEAAGPPTGVLVARIPLLALQNPLERIIYDPPGRIELGYEAFRRVRWACGLALQLMMALRCRSPLAHPVFCRSRFAINLVCNSLAKPLILKRPLCARFAEKLSRINLLLQTSNLGTFEPCRARHYDGQALRCRPRHAMMPVMAMVG